MPKTLYDCKDSPEKLIETFADTFFELAKVKRQREYAKHCHLFDLIREYFCRKELLLLTEVNKQIYIHEIHLLNTEHYSKRICFAQEECTEEQITI